MKNRISVADFPPASILQCEGGDVSAHPNE